MQSDPPQGDPRLEQTNPAPVIATAFVDPCLVYLETTHSSKQPNILVCFAATSCDIVQPGKDSRLELREVLVMRCKPDPRNKGCWAFGLRPKKLLTLESRRLVGFNSKYYSLATKLLRPPVVILNQSVRYLDRKRALALRKTFESSRSPNYPHRILAKQLLEFAKLDWSTIAEILASHQSFLPRARRNASLIGRLISVFKKKPQPAHA